MIRHGKAPFLECSSKGETRLSAFYAKPSQHGGLNIEALYQAFKVFEDGSTGLTWREAKGKRAINMDDAAKYYSYLWDTYINEHPELLKVIRNASGLSDMFGRNGCQCQATELWRIRNQDRRD